MFILLLLLKVKYMKEEYFKWYSPNLNREIDVSFGHSGYPVILFPTSMGSYHENKDMGLIESAKWYIEQGLTNILSRQH
jgi:esterase/lipase superfamily enzyme